MDTLAQNGLILTFEPFQFYELYFNEWREGFLYGKRFFNLLRSTSS